MADGRKTVHFTQPGDSPGHDSQPSIAALRPDVAAYIQSTTRITSLTDVVSGLLQNSLDSSATEVFISVDLTRRACVVEDNGCGIRPESFRPEGGLCEPYHTSTHPPASSHHIRHGMFLASLSSLSLLSVTSRHIEHTTASSLLIHRGRILSRRTPCRTHEVTLAATHGTAVQVRDLFENVPVRVKHHARNSTSTTHLDKEWDHLLLRLAAFVVAWPALMTLTIEDRENRSRRVRYTALGKGLATTPMADARIGRRSSLHGKILRVGAVMFAFHLLPRSVLDNFVPASAASNSFAIKGVISTVPSPTSKTQFISMGSTPLLSSDETKELYDTINRAFQDSAFGSPRDQDQPKVGRGPRLRDLRMGRKAVDRWPVYYLNIEHCGNSEALSLTRDWAPLCRLLLALVQGWLRANGFQSSGSAIASKTNDLRSRPLSAPVLSTDSIKHTTLKRLRSSETGRGVAPMPFSSWTRIKSSGAGMEREIWRQEPSSTELAPPTSPIYRKPEGPPKSLGGQAWLSEVLRTWQNPVFEITTSESRLQVANEPLTAAEHGFKSHEHDVRLTKQGLAQAEVLAQVDRKYILIRMPFEECKQKILAIVDQHAASERVIVESLLKELDTEASVKLSRPLHFQISSEECRLMRSRSKDLGLWGILFDVRQGKTEEDESQIIVTHLPPAIAERCMQEPRLLIELLREETYGERAPRSALKEDCTGCQHGNCHDSSEWLGKMGNCPSGMVNMINSRACRSAIMFNDELSMTECGELVRDLSRCTFPFSCAHGRVSMVPLLVMDEAETSMSSSPSIAADMKRWMSS